MNLKYEHIGFPISVNSNEHDSFTLAVDPVQNNAEKVFESAPNGTRININYNASYYKDPLGWIPSLGEKILSKGDVIDINMPNSSAPLKLSLRGSYEKPKPREIDFECTGNEPKQMEITLSFEPKDNNVRRVFKDFFESPVFGSELHLYLNGPDYFDFYVFENNEPYEEGTAKIFINQVITVNCALGQKLSAKIEETDSDNIERIKTLQLNPNETKTFFLDNYKCLSFKAIFNKLKTETQEENGQGFSLTCSRMGLTSNSYYWTTVAGMNINDPTDMLIYYDTICNVYAPNQISLELTC